MLEISYIKVELETMEVNNTYGWSFHFQPTNIQLVVDEFIKA